MRRELSVCLVSLLLVSCASERGARNPQGTRHAAPATPEQQVWLAAAKFIAANESAAVARPVPMAIYPRTTFPDSRLALSQLESQARKGMCGLSRESSTGLIRSLHWQNRRSRPLEEVFDDQPRFTVAGGRARKSNQLGLSSVVFDRSVSVAYLNVDVGGQSGSIAQLRLENGTWVWKQECASWVAWR